MTSHTESSIFTFFNPAIVAPSGAGGHRPDSRQRPKRGGRSRSSWRRTEPPAGPPPTEAWPEDSGSSSAGFDPTEDPRVVVDHPGPTVAGGDPDRLPVVERDGFADDLVRRRVDPRHRGRPGSNSVGSLKRGDTSTQTSDPSTATSCARSTGVAACASPAPGSIRTAAWRSSSLASNAGSAGEFGDGGRSLRRGPFASDEVGNRVERNPWKEGGRWTRAHSAGCSPCSSASSS
jgi:hypothetical protein